MTEKQFINSGTKATVMDVVARFATDAVHVKKMPDGYTIGEAIVVPFGYDKLLAPVLKKFKIDNILQMIGFEAQYNEIVLKFIGEFGISWVYEYLAGNKESLGYMMLRQAIAQTASHVTTHM